MRATRALALAAASSTAVEGPWKARAIAALYARPSWRFATPRGL